MIMPRGQHALFAAGLFSGNWPDGTGTGGRPPEPGDLVRGAEEGLDGGSLPRKRRTVWLASGSGKKRRCDRRRSDVKPGGASSLPTSVPPPSSATLAAAMHPE